MENAKKLKIKFQVQDKFAQYGFKDEFKKKFENYRGKITSELIRSYCKKRKNLNDRRGLITSLEKYFEAVQENKLSRNKNVFEELLDEKEWIKLRWFKLNGIECDGTNECKDRVADEVVRIIKKKNITLKASDLWKICSYVVGSKGVLLEKRGNGCVSITNIKYEFFYSYNINL